MSTTERGRRIAGCVCVVALVSLCSVRTASAQSSVSAQDKYPRFSGYVFGAPLVRYSAYCPYDDIDVVCGRKTWLRRQALPHFGGAAEWRPTRSVGIAVEAGLVVSNGYPGGIGSLNGTYYFRQTPGAGARWIPFVTGGYSLDPDLSHGGNAGAGVNFPARGGTWIRVEGRGSFWEHMRAAELRIGLVFGPRNSR